ncbi:MAG TPA: flavodoxin family protein [Desulfotomaculum sp.]|nr:MAG: NADPH-dependent FMN reductase [Peptococcaceae bacterium BRH_c8a]KJS78772.1 MAG: NADPH-dependent FMN reductase [Desulfotomaculum sp. BICA1-6]HBX24543.1 flavodoxin family protein [Desulfotomaculum sp.]
MKIIAINGSHRKGKNTAALLNTVLEEAATLGAETELLELTDYNIKLCLSCNKCLGKTQCSITDDDMAGIGEKMLAADGIVLGSPVYWANVTTLMKNFMDRTRYMHAVKNMLSGKVGAAVTNAGLMHGGQEWTVQIMEYFMQAQGLHVVDTRDQNGPILDSGVHGSLMAGIKDGKVAWWRSAVDNELNVTACKQLARNMSKLITQLSTK